MQEASPPGTPPPSPEHWPTVNGHTNGYANGHANGHALVVEAEVLGGVDAGQGERWTALDDDPVIASAK